MTSLEGVLSASKTEPAGKAAVAGKVVLVMQGGGAQAAYEGGVYEALHEAGIEPDWVIGTSIGAINGSIIAGNEVKSRLKRLREFWSRIESRPTWPSGPMFGNAANQLTTLLTGVPGFFSPNTAFLWGPEAAVGVEHAALYSVDPLRKLLPGLVDFDLANSGKPRFTLGLVGVRSGRIRYFDSRDEKIGLDHVLGSSAVPPTFPAVRIDGEAYWDGGIYSNTPVEVVFDDYPRRSCGRSRRCGLAAAADKENRARPGPRRRHLRSTGIQARRALHRNNGDRTRVAGSRWVVGAGQGVVADAAA